MIKIHDKAAPVIGISLLSDGIFLLAWRSNSSNPTYTHKVTQRERLYYAGQSRYSIHGISCIFLVMQQTHKFWTAWSITLCHA